MAVAAPMGAQVKDDATAHDSDTCDVIEPQPAWEGELRESDI